MRSLIVALLLSSSAFAQDGGTPTRTIVLIPMGDIESVSVKVVKKALAERVNADIRIDERRPLPKSAWYEPRKRWRAEKILASLDADPPKGAWKVVAITSAEISTTKDEHVDWRIAGQGELDGRNCVLSTWIYRKHFEDQQTYERRLADLTVHEFGHTLGLDHCPTKACVMRDAEGKALLSADTSTTHYCEQCRSKVGGAVLKTPK